MRPCIQCGTPTPATRCPTCYRTAQTARNQARGDRYGANHRRGRKEWAPYVEAGMVACARCTTLIEPTAPWHLDHLPTGDSRPSHAHCNTSARADAAR
jgi:hypothetical protein